MQRGLGTLTLLAWGCSMAATGAAGDGAPAAGGGDVAAIRALLEAFVASWNAGDAAAAAAVYSDPHVDVNRPQPVLGHDETVEAMRRFFTRYQSTIEVSSDEVVVAGEWAFQRGAFTLTSTPRDGGPTETETRRYVEVLRRQPDGGWRVAWGMDGPIAGSG